MNVWIYKKIKSPTQVFVRTKRCPYCCGAGIVEDYLVEQLHITPRLDCRGCEGTGVVSTVIIHNDTGYEVYSITMYPGIVSKEQVEYELGCRRGSNNVDYSTP